MKWIKLGRVFVPGGEYAWMQTHASNPVAEWLVDDVFRVYFSTRDALSRSHIAFVDLDIREPERIVNISAAPVVAPGVIGAFDDSGSSMGCLVRNGARRYLYYLGWNLGVTVPWRNAIGLAISDGPEMPFVRYSLAPVCDRNSVDPFTVSYPWIIREDGLWRMWYGSNLRWGAQQRDMDHLLKYAESDDGIAWRRDGRVAIPLKDADEYALSKPCVVRDAEGYHMWFSHRGSAYRIGYAVSADGLAWERNDETVGITVSEAGWDSETIEYPYVFDHKGKRYMFYNGNGYGRTGFGLAVQG
ncbi:MAG: hypothetical protein FJ189_03355 [Gammaproteobacteria bacterium]|nr:hypothetical protein [Gammaproteobacteria bacterium]